MVVTTADLDIKKIVQCFHFIIFIYLKQQIFINFMRNENYLIEIIVLVTYHSQFIFKLFYF